MPGGALLVVEDDALLAKALCRDLGRYADVKLARTAKDAYRALERPWLGMLIDVGLPDGSGLEVLRKARTTSNKAAFAMILTGSDEHEIYSAALECSACYVRKPASPTDLRLFAIRSLTTASTSEAAIAAVLRRWKTRCGLRDSEFDVLRLAVGGASHDEICTARNTTGGTLKKQINRLLRLTRQGSLEIAVASVLREALASVAPQSTR